MFTAGLRQLVPVTAAHFHDAQQLLVRHGLGRSLRTLDALQLAVSLPNTIAPLDAFVCADSNLCLVAAAEGLPVVNPEVPSRAFPLGHWLGDGTRERRVQNQLTYDK